MKTASPQRWWVVVATVLLAAAIGAWAQAPGGQGGQGGQGGPGMAQRLPPPPSVAMTASEGTVYVAVDGKLLAFEAKTLKKLAEVQLAERRDAPPRED